MKKLYFRTNRSILQYLMSNIPNKSNLIISGGGTIKSVMKYCDKNTNFLNHQILLSDERLVGLNSKLRNDVFFKKMIKKKMIKSKNFIHYNYSKILDHQIKKINKKIVSVDFDMAILGLGLNNHIASIFELKKNSSHYYQVNNSPKKPKNRLTVSIQKISECKKIFLIANFKKRKNEINNIYNSTVLQTIKKKIILLII